MCATGLRLSRVVGFTMELETARFGRLRFREADVLHFASGMIGFSGCCDWVLVPDTANAAVGWLQSVNHRAIALPVANPLRFLLAYRLRIPRRELDVLELAAGDEPRPLVVVSKVGESLALNLRAPLIVNFERRLGRQVVVSDGYPVRFVLSDAWRCEKKIA